MPVVSKSQMGAMAEAAHGNSTLGIPKKVGADFLNASKGMKVGKLPQRVKKKKGNTVAADVLDGKERMRGK